MEASSGCRPAKKQRVEVKKLFLLTLTSKADLVEHLKQHELDEKHLKEIGDALHAPRCDIYGQPVKEAAELSSDQLDLRQAARLALVACAAHTRGVQVTSTLSELMEKRQQNHNAVYLEQAERGVFDIDSFVFHVDQSLEQIVDASVTIFGGHKIFQFHSNPSMSRLTGRHVQCSLMRTGAIDFRKSSTNKQQLTIVAGESGSGKTASSIAAVVLDNLHNSRTLCLYHEMPPWFETSVVNAEKCGGNDEAKMQARNNKVQSYLLDLLSSLNITAHSGADTHAVLILDELGPCPTVVRALSSIYSNVLTELAFAAKVSKFFMIAVGTGLDNTTTQIGSAPDTYNFVCMSQETGEEFLSKLQANFPQQLQELIKVNSRYRIGLEAWRTLTNRRVAACFVTHTVPAVRLGLDIDWQGEGSTLCTFSLPNKMWLHSNHTRDTSQGDTQAYQERTNTTK